MNSLILSTATRVLAPVILVLSVLVFLRGHNAPGGGFIGGLLAATAFALIEKAEGLAAARRALRFRPEGVAAAGLGCALVSGLWGGIGEGHFLKGVWPAVAETTGLPLSSVALFDLGVYLVVLGSVAAILFTLEEVVAREADRGD
jgi:multicomponent Na+:H+ antiporter subunit B